jgi:hypothetical protein
MSNVNAKLSRLEAKAASLPAPPPAGDFALSRLGLSADQLRGILRAMREREAAGHAGPATLADLVPFLPPGMAESISATVRRAKQEGSL